MVKDGKLKPIPVKKFGGGLERVYSDGYKYLAEGKVSAERVVFAVRTYLFAGVCTANRACG